MPHKQLPNCLIFPQQFPSHFPLPHASNFTRTRRPFINTKQLKKDCLLMGAIK